MGKSDVNIMADRKKDMKLGSPAMRTLEGKIDPKIMTDIKKSRKVVTKEDYAADYLQMVLGDNGINFIKVRKISPRIFLFTFLDSESMDRKILEYLDLVVVQPSLRDFVLPRKVWINIIDLPMVAFNDTTLMIWLVNGARWKVTT